MKKLWLEVVLEARDPFKTIPHDFLDILNLAEIILDMILMRFWQFPCVLQKIYDQNVRNHQQLTKTAAGEAPDPFQTIPRM